MKTIIIILIIIFSIAPLRGQVKTVRGNNVTVIVNYDKNNQNRLVLDNAKQIKEYEKKSNTRLKLHYFGVGFAVGGFTVCAATMLTLFFAGRK